MHCGSRTDLQDVIKQAAKKGAGSPREMHQSMIMNEIGIHADLSKDVITKANEGTPFKH